MPKIIITSGQSQGLEYAIPPHGAILGRQSGNTVPLADEQASRRHSRISYQNGRWLLEDLGSRNGTWVDGKRITGHALVHNETIMLGDTTMRFVLQAETDAAVPLAAAALETPISKLLQEELEKPAVLPREPRATKSFAAAQITKARAHPPLQFPVITGGVDHKTHKSHKFYLSCLPEFLVIDLTEYPGLYQCGIVILLGILLVLLFWISRWLTLSLLP